MSLNCPTCGVALELSVVRPRKESIPEWLRRQVFERDDWRCVRCAATEDLTADHLYPEMFGGAATLANLQTLCRSCNSRKGSRLPLPVAPDLEAQPEAQIAPEPVRVGGVSSSKKRLRYRYDDVAFQQFWQVYPRRVGKASAFSRWKIVVREVEPQTVIEAARRYAALIEAQHLEAQFIKYPEGWLSAGRWEDELAIPPAVGASDPAYIVGTAEYKARTEAEEQAVIQREREAK